MLKIIELSNLRHFKMSNELLIGDKGIIIYKLCYISMVIHKSKEIGKTTIENENFT